MEALLFPVKSKPVCLLCPPSLLQVTLTVAPSPHPTLVHSVAIQYLSWWDKEAEPGQLGEWGEGPPDTLSLIWQGGQWADTPNTHPNPIVLSPPLPRLRSYTHSFLPSLGH